MSEPIERSADGPQDAQVRAPEPLAGQGDGHASPNVHALNMPPLPEAPVQQVPREWQWNEAVFETMLETHFAGILVYDAMGNTLWASHHVCGLTGWTLEERLGRPGYELIHPDDLEEALRTFVWLLGEAGRTTRFEQRVICKDGSVIWLEVHMKNLLGVEPVNAIVGNFHDITERKAAYAALHESEQRQRELANLDALTGLANRRAMVTALEAASAAVNAGDLADFAFFFIDLDGFKKVNDRLGHAFGDQFLRATAERLRNAAGDDAVVARIGGDEFAILSRRIAGREATEAAAHRLAHTMSDPIRIHGHLVQLPACIGAVNAGGRDWAPDDILRYADAALYAAKQEGTGRVRLFDATLESQLREHSELAEAFSRALAENQLEVHYQPIIDLRSRDVVGLEALVRWNHPTRGLLPASAFIHIAEETGLVIPLGEFVFEQVCADVTRWHARFGSAPWVSANLSAAQLIRQDFADFVREHLDRHRVPTGSVRFELTECGLFETEGPWRDRLWEAAAAGCPLLLDDFGTGYTSMRYLADFPISMLKLDKSYVQRSTTADPERRARALSLVRAVADLARSLDMRVIAEGVECEDQHRVMVEAGCTFGQGWLYEKALTRAAVEERLADGHWVL